MKLNIYGQSRLLPVFEDVLVATGTIGQTAYMGRLDGHLRSSKRNFWDEALEKGWQARRDWGWEGRPAGAWHQLPTFPQSRSTLTTEWPEQVARSAHTLENERG